MNYLAGPLTRNQIPALNSLAGAVLQAAQVAPGAAAGVAQAAQSGLGTGQPAAQAAVSAAAISPAVKSTPLSSGYTSTRSAVPAGIAEYFLTNNLTFSQAVNTSGRNLAVETINRGMIYRPVILGQSSTRLYNPKYKLDIQKTTTALVVNPDRRGMVQWENFLSDRIDRSTLTQAADPQARYAALDVPMNDVKLMTAIQKDFLDWVFRISQVTVRANEALKLFAGPETTEADFHTQCADAAREAQQAELLKASSTFDTKVSTLQDKLEREQRELAQDKAELSSRKLEEAGNAAETIAGLFGLGRKRSISSSLTKRRLTSQASSDVEESVDTIKDYQAEIASIEQEKAAALKAVSDKWGEVASQITEIPISVLKKDILLDFFGVAWMPFYLVQEGEQAVELPAFSSK